MYVHAVSTFTCAPLDNLEGLKSDLKNYTDFFFRRVNKFILLSLMGVHRCVRGSRPGGSVAVYLSTEHGNLGDTESVLHQLYRENSFPKPFNFINTMSNTASFYVAQSLKSLGRSITVSSRNVSFERGLELAIADFELGAVTEALAGGVDEAVFSRDHFVKKYDASYHDATLVEGSSWLYLTGKREGALGRVSGVRTFTEGDDALGWAAGAAGAEPVIAFGVLMPPGEKEEWRRNIPGAEELDYILDHGYYDTAAAFAVGRFFESYRGRRLLHVNRTIQGDLVVIDCESY